MTREQVRYVLGTPLVTDIFTPIAGIIVFTASAQRRFEQRKLAGFFDKEGRSCG